MDQERRKYQRYQPFYNLIELRTIDFKKSFAGFIINLSEGGAYLLVEEEIASNNDFFIRISLPENSNHVIPITLYANTVWEKDSVNKNFKEIRCQFSNISTRRKKQLCQLINYITSHKK